MGWCLFAVFVLFALFAVVEGWRVQGFRWWRVDALHGCISSSYSGNPNLQTHGAKKYPLFAFIVRRWYIIPLRLIKPFICPQIKPHEKNRKTMNEERKKNPARRRGKSYFSSTILLCCWVYPVIMILPASTRYSIPATLYTGI